MSLINKTKPLIVSLLLCTASSTLIAGNKDKIEKTEYFPVENVRITSGPFKTAQEKGIEYLLEINPDRLLTPYLKEAGLTPKAENYTNWENTGLDGHIGGHYLSALAYMYAATGNNEIGKRLEYMLSELKRCQDAAGNGYLSGVPGGVAMWDEVSHGNIKAGGFDLNGKWVPLYNIHKIYAGLKDVYIQTHNDTAKDMLIKLTDWMEQLVSELSDEQIQTMLMSEHGGLNEIFADVAVISSNPRYLELARKFSHKAILDPLIAGDGKLTGKHANTQIPKVIGYKRIADIENNAEWEKAVELFWDDVVNHRSVSIGGNSVFEHFHSPDDFTPMLESEQGPETCNTYNMLRLTKMLYESNPAGRYTDYAERAMFNHILSSQNPEHGGFVYFTPMRSGHYRVYSQPHTSFWCCVGSGMENQARYGEYIYASKGNEIYVNMFIPSTLEWCGNKIEQKTIFPESDRTTIEISEVKHKKFAVNIRIPGWTDSQKITVTLNDKPAEYKVESGYINIDRKWKKGDRLEVTLPMQLHTEQLADGSSNYSILYGPIVLASNLGTEGQTGLFANDSRGGHIASGPKLPLQEMPVIVGEPKDIISYVKKESDSPLVFTLSNVYPAKYNEMTLVPFASLNECRYMVYWPVINKNQLAQRTAEIAAQQNAIAELENKTADKVICGEQQPESDHFISMDKTVTGSDNDKRWRRADATGWFSYKLSKAGKSPNSLRVYYRPANNRSASVWIDNNKIGELTHDTYNGVTYIDFPLFNAISDPCVIKIVADSESTPNIYEIRLMDTNN